MVETINLSKVYRRGKVEVPALVDVNLQVTSGEIVGIVGPSGSGKTTLLNLIGGLDKPTKGKIFVNDVDVTSLNERELAEYRLKMVGFVFQFYNLIPTLTALENVELPMALAGVPKSERRKRAFELLEMVGLEARASHKPDELSGGEQQRVAIARALANNPAIVLADEPTGDLDSKSARSLMNLVRRLNKENGQTFIIVTHDPIVVDACTRVYSIRDGRIEGSREVANH
ncbi:MAG: ABC transporter ATP-binding protein [Candidatus Nezhaarchaeota archaeon]|nr:ABC transporter ATP-binding protein [Candidatus Nezhaarchaeota archaeon]